MGKVLHYSGAMDGGVEYETTSGVCVVLVTCPDEALAAKLSQTLVAGGLAACVTRIPGARSVYRWRGAIEESEEVQLLIKTRRERLAQLSAELAALHPYEEPELLVIDASGGRPGYLGWIEEATAGAAG